MVIQVLATLLLSYNAQATTARVLIEEKAKDLSMRGQFELFCMRKSKNGSLIKKPCERVSHKNKHSQFSAAQSQFRVEAEKNKLQLTLLAGEQSKRFEFYGKFFRFEGEFYWQDRKFKKLDLVFRKRTPHWVLHLPLKNYLKGVLSSEVPGLWPLEVLKAQAIASRTYFLWKKAQARTYFDVRSDHMDQVYKMRKIASDGISQAIDETENVVLVGKTNKKLFPAFFHSDCGGHTSTEQAVWMKGDPHNHPVPDKFCAQSKRSHWKYRIGHGDLIRNLHKIFLLPQKVKLLKILPRIVGRERAHIVDFLFSSNIVKRMNANNFRKMMGFGKVKSTNFTVTEDWDGFVFQGKGYGHGVGMCQWGAKRWADNGRNFKQILNHYYPNAGLVQCSEENSFCHPENPGVILSRAKEL